MTQVLKTSTASFPTNLHPKFCFTKLHGCTLGHFLPLPVLFPLSRMPFHPPHISVSLLGSHSLFKIQLRCQKVSLGASSPLSWDEIVSSLSSTPLKPSPCRAPATSYFNCRLQKHPSFPALLLLFLQRPALFPSTSSIEGLSEYFSLHSLIPS